MILNRLAEFGWIFIYIFAFGISDLIVKKYIVSDNNYLLYYIILGIIGIIIIFYKNIKKITDKKNDF